MSRQMSRQMSNQSERVLPIESWSDLQKYLSTNHKARQKGLKKYEKEFLARYKKHQKPKQKNLRVHCQRDMNQMHRTNHKIKIKKSGPNIIMARLNCQT